MVWWAVNTEATGPSNIVKLMAVWSILGAIAIAHALKTEQEPDPRPTWLKRFLNVSDVSLVLMLAWWGWWWCAAAFGFGAMACIVYRDRKGKAGAPQPATNPCHDPHEIHPRDY